jgi:hypothetical protein
MKARSGVFRGRGAEYAPCGTFRNNQPRDKVGAARQVVRSPFDLSHQDCTAIHVEDFPGNEASVLGAQEQNRCGNLFRLADTS